MRLAAVPAYSQPAVAVVRPSLYSAFAAVGEPKYRGSSAQQLHLPSTVVERPSCFDDASCLRAAHYFVPDEKPFHCNKT
jgi:hypothetical protein